MTIEEIKDHLRNGAYICYSRMLNNKPDEITLWDEDKRKIGGIDESCFTSMVDNEFVKLEKEFILRQNFYYKINKSPEFIERENQVVYTYMDISGLSVRCQRDGEWKFNPYNYREVVKYLNDVEGYALNIYNRADKHYIGLRIGILIERIANRCQKEYNGTS